MPSVAPSPTSAPCAAPSPSMALPPLLTPYVEMSPLFHVARFANPAHVYHHRGRTDSSPPSAPLVCASARFRAKPLLHHSVAIHHDLDHVHPMVMCRSAGVLCPIDLLVFTTATAPSPSHVPSSIHAAFVDPHRCHAIKYDALLANHTWDLVPHPSGTNVLLASGASTTNSPLTSRLIATRLVGSFEVSLSALEWIMMRPSAPLSTSPPFGSSSPSPSPELGSSSVGC
jgi:hypothetical protein